MTTEPTTGDTVGSLRATLAAAEADGWRGWACCEHHENRPNGLPCDGMCCNDCPSLTGKTFAPGMSALTDEEYASVTAADVDQSREMRQSMNEDGEL